MLGLPSVLCNHPSCITKKGKNGKTLAAAARVVMRGVGAAVGIASFPPAKSQLPALRAAMETVPESQAALDAAEQADRQAVLECLSIRGRRRLSKSVKEEKEEDEAEEEEEEELDEDDERDGDDDDWTKGLSREEVTAIRAETSAMGSRAIERERFEVE